MGYFNLSHQQSLISCFPHSLQYPCHIKDLSGLTFHAFIYSASSKSSSVCLSLKTLMLGSFLVHQRIYSLFKLSRLFYINLQATYNCSSSFSNLLEPFLTLSAWNNSLAVFKGCKSGISFFYML